MAPLASGSAPKIDHRGLPKDFADRFFRRERRNRKPATAKEIAIDLAAARATVEQFEAKHVEALALEAAEAANDARAKAVRDQKIIDKAQKQADAAAARLAALKSELQQ
jgi:hypothetical protein